MSNENIDEASFRIAATAYLRRELPANWFHLDRVDHIAFVEEYTWAPIKHFSAMKVLELIEAHHKRISEIRNCDTIEEVTELYRRGVLLMDDKSLRLSTPDGFTFAHFLAMRNHVFTNPNILKLKDENGVTVAHVMALNGHVFENEEMYKTVTNSGLSVFKVSYNSLLERTAHGLDLLNKQINARTKEVLGHL